MNRKFWKILLIICCVVVLIVALGGVLFVEGIKKRENYTTLDTNKLTKVCSALQVLDTNGQQLNDTIYYNNIKQVPLSALPKHVYMAFVAVEDKRFFTHRGVDVRRVCGAILHNVKSGTFKEGASTISQQLIKNTHLDNQKTIERKVNEMLVAMELEKCYTKEQILEIYLNTIYFGRNAYGIETASNVYFSKSASELTISESAILAGMIKAPNTYAPDKDIDKCKNRRNLVLDLMCEQGVISQNELDVAKSEPISYVEQKQLTEKTYMYYTLKEACKILNMTECQLLNSNYTIETYCDSKLQRDVCNIVRKDATKDKNGRLADIFSVVSNNVGQAIACYSRGENADKKGQPGSTFKPIAVYAPALNEKIITQASPVLDEPTDFGGYKPQNVNGYCGWTTVTQAVCKSLNVPSVKVLNSLTTSTAERYLQKLGFYEKQNLSLALGNVNGGVTPLELEKCYATLANGGVCNQTRFIKRIIGAKGVVFEAQSEVKQVYKPTTAFLMTDMLLDVVKDGTARNLQKSYQVAGKTGTVGDKNGNTDAIVAGYTTEHTFVVWHRGQFDNKVCGANTPCKLSAELLDCIYQEHTPKDFAPPKGVSCVTIDENLLKNEQQVKLSQNGLQFWFDDDNAPMDKVQEATYDYTIDCKNYQQGCCLQLKKVQNADWELFAKIDGSWEKVELNDNCHIYNGKDSCQFFAKLIKDGKVVYRTPVVEICGCNTTEQKTTDKKSWLDFWYFK